MKQQITWDEMGRGDRSIVLAFYSDSQPKEQRLTKEQTRFLRDAAWKDISAVMQDALYAIDWKRSIRIFTTKALTRNQ